MATNAQKTPLPSSLQDFTQSKIGDGIQLQGKAFPVSVVTVNDWSVEVKFELNAVPFTIPNVTVPFADSHYERPPIQVGDLGWVQPADARLGGVSGLGSGTASLAAPANLSALVFEPITNANWSAPPDKNAYLIQGPNGFILRNMTDDYSIVGNGTAITIAYGSGVSFVVNPSGVTANAATMHLTGNLFVDGNVSAGNGATASIPTYTGQTMMFQNGIFTGLAS